MNPNQPHGNQQQGGQDQASQPQGGHKPDSDDRRSLPGIILIGVGLLALFGSLDLESWLSRLVLAVLFAAAAYFAYVAGERNKQPLLKWAAAPLAVLAVSVLISGGVGEALVVGVFALAFYFVWQRDRLRWWALIPAGVLGTIAVTQLVDATFGAFPAWLVLIGFAVTFYALTRLEAKPQRWAIFPAAALAVAAALTLVSASGWLGPVVLIGIGVLLLVRSGALDGLTGAGAPRVQAEPQAEPAEAVEPAEAAQAAEPSVAAGSPSPPEPNRPTGAAPMPDAAQADADSDADSDAGSDV